MEDIWEEYGLDKIQGSLNSMFPDYTISLSALMEEVVNGDILGAIGVLYEGSIGGMLGQLDGLKEVLLWLLLLGMASSLMSHFVEVFDRHQIADLSYYFIYLLFVTVLFRCFTQTATIAEELIEKLILFIEIMVPTYLLAVGAATGVTTVMANSQLLVLVVYGVQCILGGWLYDFISIYVVLSVVNGIWIEQKLSMLVEFIGRIIVFVLKCALTVVTGVSIFQTLITPVIDSARASVIQKTVSAIPGIGNMAGGVVELVVGSAVVIKNSIGVVLLMLLILLCAVPLFKIYAIAFLLRLAAALLGMISDKRLVRCTNDIGEGCMLMFRTAQTSVVLFLVVISVLAAFTNRGL